MRALIARAGRTLPAWWSVCLSVFVLSAVVLPAALRAQQPTKRLDAITLKNGLQYTGKVGKLSGIAIDPLNPPINDAELIVMIDDELKRVFVPRNFVQNYGVVETTANAGIKVPQRVAENGSKITSVGILTNVEPFDEWGRRTVTMQTSKGPVHIVQGITQVTPTYTILEAVVSTQSYPWKTKIATSSIPRETLSRILRRQAGDDLDKRHQIVRLYIEAERYSDARAEMEECIKLFPKVAELNKQAQLYQQASANRLIKEIELRRDAGQHQLALKMASEFPLEGIAGETRIRVGEIVASYKELKDQGDLILKMLNQDCEALPDDRQRTELQPIRDEIALELSIHNIDRFADYLRLSEGGDLKPDQKLSLAISGWLLGKGEATENLSVAISLFNVRNLVADYLRSRNEPERRDIITQLESLEGGSPTFIAKLLAMMKPAVDTEHEERNPPGAFEITVPGLSGQGDVKYFVQLPPEYTPYRRYPTIVSLNGALSSPVDQINWWAGDYDPTRKMRLGQASRRGYIVIAPVWTKEQQSKYEYSAREHAAVLFSLRDAQTRFSIDTDRVFLHGHSMGGDAAWDIATAHPDLWAGVLPVGATSDKYLDFNWRNGKYVPLYYVAGEMDGDRFFKCSTVLDKYLTLNNYDAVVVQYQGRGHEHFYDDIQNMFTWMGAHQRPALVKDFECSTLRPWDNYFWWLELEDLPAKFICLPAAWPPRGGLYAQTTAKLQNPTSIIVSSTAQRATLYLTPDMVDFEKKISIKFNKTVTNVNLQPSTSVMLEDARTRGDRLHPFWQKVSLGGK